MKQNLRKLGIFVTLPLTTVFLTGCNNELFQAVREFSNSRSDASQSVTVIASDFYESCVRRSLKEPIQLTSFVRFQSEDLRPAAFERRQELLQDCHDAPRQIGQNFEQANSLLLNYMGALEALASEEVVVFPDTTRDKLTEAIQGLATIDLAGSTDNPVVALELNERNQVVAAGVGLFQFISRLFFDDFRRRELSEVITETDRAIQEYTKGLKKIVERGYIDGYLAQELDIYFRYYSSFTSDEIANILPKVSDPDAPIPRNTLPFNSSASIDNGLSSEVSPLLKRKKLALLYIDFLDEVAQGHCDLAVRVSDGQRKPAECIGDSDQQEEQPPISFKQNSNEQEFRKRVLYRLARIKSITDEMKDQL